MRSFLSILLEQLHWPHYSFKKIFFRHIAGLNANRAKNIIEWREKNGPFINREQLKKVKGLGPKSFQQCAGFIRVNQDYIRTFCRSLLKCTLLVLLSTSSRIVPHPSRGINSSCLFVHSFTQYVLTVWSLLGTGNTAGNKSSNSLAS